MTGNWSQEEAAQVRQLVGDIDDEKLIAILSLEPTLEEIEEAVAFRDGEEIDRTTHRRLAGKVSDIYDILIADLEDESHLH